MDGQGYGKAISDGIKAAVVIALGVGIGIGAVVVLVLKKVFGG